MNNIGKLLLAGGAGFVGWLVYQRNQSPSQAAGAPGTPGVGPILPPPPRITPPVPLDAGGAPWSPILPPPPRIPPPAPLTETLSSLLLEAAGNVGSLNGDQWSYYYQNLQGKPVISPETFGQMMASIGATGSTNMTVNQFIQALSSVGLGALPGRLPRLPMTRGAIGAVIRARAHHAPAVSNYVRPGTPMRPTGGGWR
jgi:hypothetical protein